MDYDAYLNSQLNRYLDSLDKCEYCGKEWEDEEAEDHECDSFEPDPDRFRDEDPNDREDY